MKNENDNKKPTRTKRNGTERRKHKSIYFAVIGVLLIVLLLLVVSIFSGNGESSINQTTEADQSSVVQDTSEAATEEENEEETASSETTDTSTSEEENTEEEPEETDENESEEEVTTEPAEPSDDLVTDAYTGNWDPVGTDQEGSHTTNFSDGSQDRIEIKQAVTMVTGLNPDDMIEWWVGNDGPGKVVATVSDTAETEIYRVYLTWVDNEGWQPTKVEELSENDKN